MGRRAWIGLALVIVAGAGCTGLEEHKIDVRNRLLARQAWKNLRDVYCDVDYPEDFGKGFRQAYFDVAGGTNGCPPVLPPREYWTVNFVNPLGHRRVHAWYEGYKYGATVAEQDGIGIWLTVPTGKASPPVELDLEPLLKADAEADKRDKEAVGDSSSSQDEKKAPAPKPSEPPPSVTPGPPVVEPPPTPATEPPPAVKEVLRPATKPSIPKASSKGIKPAIPVAPGQ